MINGSLFVDYIFVDLNNVTNNDGTGNDTGVDNNVTTVDIDNYISQSLGEKRQGAGSVILLTVIYGTIFLTGIAGNLCTCIVIYRNIYMHTVTNYYLASLALSDILTLLFGKLKNIHSSCLF